MGVIGTSAANRLARSRDFEEAVGGSPVSHHWNTVCLRFYRTKDDTLDVATALQINLDGDGGWPGAVGYDAAGQTVAVIVSTGRLPWSLFGVPGDPPPEAAASEPSASVAPAATR